MDFKTYFMGLDVPSRDAFAKRVGSSRGHLTNVAYGKPCAEKLAINIERESSGDVRCESLRPDVDWAFLRGTAPLISVNSTVASGAHSPEAGEGIC